MHRLCRPRANTLSHLVRVDRTCRSAASVAHTLDAILQYGGNVGSVCLYMAHGGTNFGFWAGANGNLFDITSYDYDCPISEDGCTGQPGIGGANKFQVCSLRPVRLASSLDSACADSQFPTDR